MTVLEAWMEDNEKRDVDLASMTGFSHRTIERAKLGEKVHHSTLRALADATGIPLGELQKTTQRRQTAAVG